MPRPNCCEASRCITGMVCPGRTIARSDSCLARPACVVYPSNCKFMDVRRGSTSERRSKSRHLAVRVRILELVTATLFERSGRWRDSLCGWHVLRSNLLGLSILPLVLRDCDVAVSRSHRRPQDSSLPVSWAKHGLRRSSGTRSTFKSR